MAGNGRPSPAGLLAYVAAALAAIAAIIGYVRHGHVRWSLLAAALLFAALGWNSSKRPQSESSG